MKTSHRVTVCTIALCLPLRSVMAQSASSRGKFEFGTDINVTKVLDGDRETSLQLPGQLLRAGYFISPRFSIEAAMGLQYAAIEGSSTVFTNAQLGLLITHRADPRRAQIYAHPYAALSSFHLSAGAGLGAHFRRTVTSTGPGVGVGLRVPLAEHLASRTEMQFDHIEAPRLRGENNLRLALGISYITR